MLSSTLKCQCLPRFPGTLVPRVNFRIATIRPVTPVRSSACEALLDRRGNSLDIAITNCSPERSLRIPPERIDLHDAGIAHHGGSSIGGNREKLVEPI